MCVLLCLSGKEGEGEDEKAESEGEPEEEEGELMEEVGSHPFAAMTPDQDSERRNQLGRTRPPSQEEIQQKRCECELSGS